MATRDRHRGTRTRTCNTCSAVETVRADNPAKRCRRCSNRESGRLGALANWAGHTPALLPYRKPPKRHPRAEPLPGEEWRAVPGFPDYHVSDLGRIMRVTAGHNNITYPGRLLTPCEDAGGRWMVNVRLGRKSKQMKVHRAVCLAFHGPQPDRCEVAHNDGDMANNRADNLRWATPVENNQDKQIHGTQPFGEEIWNAKLTDEAVLEARGRYRSGGVSYRQLGEDYGISMMGMYNAVRGKTWKHLPL